VAYLYSVTFSRVEVLLQTQVYHFHRQLSAMLRSQSLSALLIASLVACLAPSQLRAQCLVEYCLWKPSTEFSFCYNPDSTLVDTCTSSWTYGKYFNRGLFRLEFRYSVIDVPYAPYDSVVEVRWTDIDTSYSLLRAAFAQLENSFGGLWLRKMSPNITDTMHAANKHFELRFDSIVQIDSVISIMRQSSRLMNQVATGFKSAPAHALSVNRIKQSMRPIVCWSPANMTFRIGGEATDLSITLVDILGRIVYARDNSQSGPQLDAHLNCESQVLYAIVDGRFAGRLMTCP
jgi:hypothetical protein